MARMDPESFLDLANQVTKLKMFPYFDLAHAALCCLAVRDDLANGEFGFVGRDTSSQCLCNIDRLTAILSQTPTGAVDLLHVGHLLRRHPRQPPVGGARPCSSKE